MLDIVFLLMSLATIVIVFGAMMILLMALIVYFILKKTMNFLFKKVIKIKNITVR